MPVWSRGHERASAGDAMCVAGRHAFATSNAKEDTMALALTKAPDEEPTTPSSNRRVRVGPITQDVQIDQDYEPDVCDHAYGVRATCELYIDVGEKRSWIIVQRITSPGIWGIECPDPDNDSYVAEVFAEEREMLLSMLRSLGCAPEVTS